MDRKHEITVLAGDEHGRQYLADRCTMTASDVKDAAEKYAKLFDTASGVRKPAPGVPESAGQPDENTEVFLQRELRPILDVVKARVFNATYDASDEEAFGILIAKFYEWDGLAILRTAEAALTDANFHSEAGTVSQMADRIAAE